MTIFNSYVNVYQRVDDTFIHYLSMVIGYVPLLTIINNY